MANKKTETVAEPLNNTVLVDDNDGFTLVDGGEIPPGWGPQLSEKHSTDVERLREERAEKGMVKCRTDVVIGTFAQGSAWNRPCYNLVNATAIGDDGKRETFPLLRLPEATVLYKALEMKRVGAVLKIVYRGSVKVAKGKAHRFDVNVKDMADQLSAPREGALKLLSEAEKDHLEAIEKLQEELQAAKRESSLRMLVVEKRRLLSSGAVVDADLVDDVDDEMATSQAESDFEKRRKAAFG